MVFAFGRRSLFGIIVFANVEIALCFWPTNTDGLFKYCNAGVVKEAARRFDFDYHFRWASASVK